MFLEKNYSCHCNIKAIEYSINIQFFNLPNVHPYTHKINNYIFLTNYYFLTNIKHSTTQLTDIYSQICVNHGTVDTNYEDSLCVLLLSMIFVKLRSIYFFSLFFFGFHLVFKASFVVFFCGGVFSIEIFSTCL